VTRSSASAIAVAPPAGRAPILRAGAIAGVLAFVFSIAELVAKPPLVSSAILSLLEALCLALWLVAVYVIQREKIRTVGRAGAFAAIVGIPLLLTANSVMAMTGNTEPSPALILLLVTGGVGAVWGILALGTASFETAVLPGGAVALWTVGLLTGILGSSYVGGLLTAGGIVWSSITLWKGHIPGRSLTAISPEAAHPSPGGRLAAMDALRGTIMILMAIDHASLFVRRWHPFEIWNQPLPDYPDLAALLTRVATHPCAPGFFFLMGAGMILFADSRRRLGWSWGKITGRLALRGVLLIVLEQVVVDLATSGQIYAFDFSILAGLGGTMITAALLIRARGVALAGAGAAILLVMQVVPLTVEDWSTGLLMPFRMLTVPGSAGPFSVLYPIIPWLGVVLLGMGFGRLLQVDRERAYRLALIVGLASLALFPIVRLSGDFGNLQPLASRAAIDVLNLVKYPPSLSFLLLALGFDLVLLYVFAAAGERLERYGRPVLTLGKTALYFFLGHWFIYRLLGEFFVQPGALTLTYLAWAIGLVMMVPVCQTYARLRRASPVGSIWRMI
jgi:uncharacterized membrane protein